MPNEDITAITLHGPASAREPIAAALSEAGFAVVNSDQEAYGLDHGVLLIQPDMDSAELTRLYEALRSIDQHTGMVMMLPTGLRETINPGSEQMRDIRDIIVAHEEAFIQGAFAAAAHHDHSHANTMMRLLDFGSRRDRSVYTLRADPHERSIRDLCEMIDKVHLAEAPTSKGFDYRSANQAPRSQRRRGR